MVTLRTISRMPPKSATASAGTRAEAASVPEKEVAIGLAHTGERHNRVVRLDHGLIAVELLDGIHLRRLPFLYSNHFQQLFRLSKRRERTSSNVLQRFALLKHQTFRTPIIPSGWPKRDFDSLRLQAPEAAQRRRLCLAPLPEGAIVRLAEEGPLGTGRRGSLE